MPCFGEGIRAPWCGVGNRFLRNDARLFETAQALVEGRWVTAPNIAPEFIESFRAGEECSDN